MALTRRIGFARFSRWGENLGRLDVSEAEHLESLDGTDELNITCSDDINKGDRIVWIDLRGVCHEHIVDETSRTHDSTSKTATKATCINSINELWDDWVDDKRPSGAVDAAISAVLSGTRWEVGACDVERTASRTLYHMSAREAISDVVEAWGGEIETEIEHDGASIVSRKLSIKKARGDQQSPKRFTWTKDLVSVTRTVESDNPATRVYGYGKGVETDSGGYGRRLTFADVNGGKEYVEDEEATKIWGHLDDGGNIVASCTSFVDEQCEDAAQLLRETKDYLATVKDPRVSYTANVIDLQAFGRDWEGVGVGDLVSIIDKGFSADGIRLKGRVSSITRNLLTGDASVTFGNLSEAMTSAFESISSTLKSHTSQNASYDAAAGTSASWLEQLQDSLNAQFASVGTYKIETFELGTMWSNVPLDPETGLPVSPTSSMWAVNVNGMGLRLASSLTPAGEWDWKTFLTGGMVNADCINAGSIDAALVKIKNLIQIGDEEDGIKISKNRISFSVDGKDNALLLKALPYSINNDFIYNSNGTYLLESPTDGASDRSKHWYTDKKPYIEASGGLDRAYIKIIVTAHVNGSPKIIEADGYVPYKQTITLAGSKSEGFELTAFLTNVGALGFEIKLYKAESTSLVYTVYASYRVENPSGEITCRDGSTFLTDRNIPAVLNGGETFSGQVCIPFFYNNFARNHNLYFKNGVLIHYEQLSAGDAGFRDQY